PDEPLAATAGYRARLRQEPQLLIQCTALALVAGEEVVHDRGPELRVAPVRVEAERRVGRAQACDPYDVEALELGVDADRRRDGALSVAARTVGVHVVAVV